MWSGSLDVSVYSRTTAKRQAGFSLLEVLVAFVIMGLVVTAILQLLGNSLRSVAMADEYATAIQIAESKMASVGHLIPVEIGSHTGKLQDKFNWHVNIEKSVHPMPEISEKMRSYPYQINIEITWPLATAKHRFQLSSLRFGKAP